MYYLFALASLSGLLNLAQALHLSVASGGGNASSPILYGILFEVRCVVQLDVFSKLTVSRMFITPATVDCTVR
jgi:hypothetical protein